MYAVIRTGGKQYLVAENDRISVEKIPVAGRTGDTITFEDVLLLVGKDGSVTTGTPRVSGAQVTAQVVRDGKAKKIDVVKYKPKVRYRKMTGHRQPFTEVKITKITPADAQAPMRA